MARTRPKPLDDNPISAGSAPPPKPPAIPLPKGWSRPREALGRVTSVRTIFPDFNRAVRRGGLPTGRIVTVHGPTHGGKSAFVIGLCHSFVAGGHPGALVDAEHATGQEFVEELMGNLEKCDNFFALRPHNYEETIDAVDAFLSSVSDARKANPALRSICAIDSINKLVPKRELQQVLAQVSGDAPAASGRFKREGSSDKMAKGHFGRDRARLNQSWLDHLVPMLEGAGCSLVLIAQEREEEADGWAPQDDFKIKGGAALRFDASLLIRVSKAKPMYDPPSEHKEPNIIGFQHKVRIHKSKVGHMDGRWTDCVFHLSNGRFAPPGFDTARDALYVATNLGLVASTTGGWLSWRKRRWQGINKAVTALSQDPEQLQELLGEINAELDKQEGR